MLEFKEEPIDGCICVCVGIVVFGLVLYLHLNEAGKVSGLQSLALSLFNQRVKTTLISQPGKVTYRAPLPKSFFSRLHLSPFPFFFIVESVAGRDPGEWCHVLWQRAQQWGEYENKSKSLSCSVPLVSVKRLHKVSFHNSGHHHTTLTLLLRDSYLYLKIKKAHSKVKLVFLFPPIEHLKRT